MRFLFSMQPSTAHLHLFLPTAQALLARGHDVTVVTAARMTARAEQAGVPTLAAGMDWSDEDITSYFPDFADVPPERAPAFFLATICARRTAPPMLAGLDAIIRATPPDVIVRDFTEFGSLVAAEHHGIPSAVLRLGASNRTPTALAGMVSEALAPLRPDPARPLRTNGDLELHYAPRTWFPAEADLPAGTHRIRPDVFDNTITTGVLPAIVTGSDPRPLVYVTLGTVWSRPERLQPILDGLASLPVRVVATTGRFDPGELDAPANASVARYLPNSVLLGHVDAVVAHGGFTTVMGVVAAGKPTVMIPFSADQPLNAARCQALGTSITIDPAALTATAVAGAVERLLGDPRYASRAREEAVDVATMPGPETAANLLESLA